MAQRNERIDFCKGLLIIGVIYGHSVTALKGDAAFSVGLHQFVRTFDMPLFMLLSGYFLSNSLAKYSSLTVSKNRTTQILLPVFVWNILFYLFSVLFFSEDFSWKGMMGSLTHLWFLWAVWVSSLVTATTVGVLKNRAISAAALMLFVVALHFIDHPMWNMAYMLPFFVVGFFWKDVFDRISPKGQRWLKIASIVVFLVCWCFWDNRYVVWNTHTYLLRDTAFAIKAALFRACIGLTGCISMKAVYEKLYDWMTRKGKSNGSTRLICRLGRNTMAIYILQAFLVEVCLKRFVGNTLAQEMNLAQATWTTSFLFGYLMLPIVALCLTVLIDLLAQGIKKIPLFGKFLFGRKW